MAEHGATAVLTSVDLVIEQLLFVSSGKEVLKDCCRRSCHLDWITEDAGEEEV
jgi:hypothetical protein